MNSTFVERRGEILKQEQLMKLIFKHFMPIALKIF